MTESLLMTEGFDEDRPKQEVVAEVQEDTQGASPSHIGKRVIQQRVIKTAYNTPYKPTIRIR